MIKFWICLCICMFSVAANENQALVVLCIMHMYGFRVQPMRTMRWSSCVFCIISVLMTRPSLCLLTPTAFLWSVLFSLITTRFWFLTRAQWRNYVWSALRQTFLGAPHSHKECQRYSYLSLSVPPGNPSLRADWSQRKHLRFSSHSDSGSGITW